jgi:GDP-L-fucose synthase
MGIVLVTGANGMVGKAVLESFRKNGILAVGLTRQDADLCNSKKTFEVLATNQVDLLIHCAALVGGIKANIDGGPRFFLENWQIDNSVISAARSLQIPKLIYIGASCMYPANLPKAVKESDLLSGPIEPTNYDFALAKILGSQLVQSIAKTDGLSWKVLVPSNLYGPGDHFNNEKSHLLSAVISKLILAKESNCVEVEMWGDGSPKREFTFVEDFADWIYGISSQLENLPSFLNVGSGEEHSVLEYYRLVANALKYKVNVLPNLDMPGGSGRKLIDSSLAKSFGWHPKTCIETGLEKTIDWYLSSRNEIG